MKLSRRSFLHSCATAAVTRSLCRSTRAAESAPELTGEQPLFRLHEIIRTPVRIKSIDLLKSGKVHLLRAVSADGAIGFSMPNERITYLQAILQQKVIPCFLGQDARDVEALVDRVYVHQSNYKLAGLALWNPVGWAEFALFDLLGKAANKSVGELLGGVIRREIPVYMSSMRRDTTPEQEVEWMGKRLAETGAQAVKLKIGGRMSRNVDAAPGRTERLVALARKTWGDAITLQVDANGSYDARKGIEVGRMLEEHDVYLYEEPCPWEDFEDTKRVVDALKRILVAGGEQDTSYEKFRWYVRNRGLDIVQPDVNYNGGFTRTIRVARLAVAAKLDITPHAPQAGFATAYMVHFASVTPNLGRFQEYNAAPRKPESWFSPSFEVKAGSVKVPTGPGLGIEIDPDFLKNCQPV